MASSVLTNYPQLQNLIKRDPSCYIDEFKQQLTFFQNVFDTVRLAPQDQSDSFCELLTFICHVSHCYKAQCSHLPTTFIQILQDFSSILNPSIRISLVKSLFTLKNKGLVDTFAVISGLLSLFKCQDKNLRELLFDLIRNDIRNANKRAKNLSLNRSLQNLFFSVLEGTGRFENASGLVVRYSLRLLVDLFRKNVWNDERTANLIAKCCFSKDTKTAVIAMKFFVLIESQSATSNSDSENDSDEESAEVLYKKLVRSSHVSGNSKAKKAHLKRALEKMKKSTKSNHSSSLQFHAIEMLHDPQTFAERLFSSLKSTSERFKVKQLMIHLLSAVIAVHKLLILDFYQFIVRFLTPQQRDVTLLLTYAAQSCHESVPADEVEIVIRAVANNFVGDHCATEVIVVGLNAIREIARRSPKGMTDVLMQDLAQYKNYKDKGVMMAARSLIGLFREVNPSILHRKDRGKDANISVIKKNRTDKLPDIVKNEPLEEIDSESDDEESESTVSDYELDSETEELDSEVEEFDSENEELDSETAEIDSEDEECEGRDRKYKSDSDCEELEGKANDNNESTNFPKSSKNISKNDDSFQSIFPTNRILTNDDFKRIKRQALLSSLSASVDYSSTSEDSSVEADSCEILNLVSPSVISHQPKKRKATYDERIASIEDGRKGRKKFKSKKGSDDRGSITNREKSKGKNFLMMLHKKSVSQKKLRSAKQRQQVKAAHVKRQKMRK